MDSTFWVGPASEPDTYQLVSTLGTGGEGQVWRAVLPLSEAGRRDVAIKVQPVAAGDAEQDWTRFGHLLKSLAHPGLVRVSDVFIGPWMHRQGAASPDQPARYLVMDFVEGVTLTQWLAENPDAPISSRVAMLHTIAAALDEMHSGRTTQVPVAHGDVKPANVILRPDGGAVLVDLGLARLSDAVGVSGRTNPYAAPELHVLGAQATPETDAFAFVATLAHLVTGQPPPLDAYGYLDLRALEQMLANHPLTYRRPALNRQLLAALAAQPANRPRQLGMWVGSLGETLSQVTSNVAAGPAGYADAPAGPVAATMIGQPTVSGPPIGGLAPAPWVGMPPGPAPSPEPAERSGRLAWVWVTVGVLLLLAASYVVGVLTRPHQISAIFGVQEAAATGLQTTVTETVDGTGSVTTTVTETVTAEEPTTSGSDTSSSSAPATGTFSVRRATDNNPVELRDGYAIDLDAPHNEDWHIEQGSTSYTGKGDLWLHDGRLGVVGYAAVDLAVTDPGADGASCAAESSYAKSVAVTKADAAAGDTFCVRTSENRYAVITLVGFGEDTSSDWVQFGIEVYDPPFK